MAEETKKYITVAALEQLVPALEMCAEYLGRDNKKAQEAVAQYQDLIKQVEKIDLENKTQAEYDAGGELKGTHGVGRMLMFLLNYYGEMYLNNGLLTIFEDDPAKFSTSHTNTYKLVLKDKDTHDKFGGYAPTGDDQPYDFNTEFQQQLTVYADGNTINTTATAWDSFQKSYSMPRRKLDFKGAFWKNGHEHFVNYILQLTGKKELKLLTLKKQPKAFNFIPADGAEIYYEKYFKTISSIRFIGDYAWNNFIFSDKPKDINK